MAVPSWRAVSFIGSLAGVVGYCSFQCTNRYYSELFDQAVKVCFLVSGMGVLAAAQGGISGLCRMTEGNMGKISENIHVKVSLVA